MSEQEQGEMFAVFHLNQIRGITHLSPEAQLANMLREIDERLDAAGITYSQVSEHWPDALQQKRPDHIRNILRGKNVPRIDALILLAQVAGLKLQLRKITDTEI